MGNDEKGKWLDATMNEMSNSIVKDYEKMNNKVVKISNVPAVPGSYLMKIDKDDAENLENYRIMVGRIMYLTSKISPECLNASRELARHMHNPNNDHWEEMEKMIGYFKGK